LGELLGCRARLWKLGKQIVDHFRSSDAQASSSATIGAIQAGGSW
jgi:hypothetical protein